MIFKKNQLSEDVRKNLILQGVLKYNEAMEMLEWCSGIQWPATEEGFCETVNILAHRALYEGKVLAYFEGMDSAIREDLEKNPATLLEIKEILSHPLRDVLSVQSVVNKFSQTLPLSDVVQETDFVQEDSIKV
ncbi:MULTISPECIES: hypothetical protein [Pseudomonas]|uniref:Uncharacterized protein n=5 Tax=Pseudomonas TaxID=286 RepID=A0AAD0M6S9_9PSED|nr:MULTISPECIES: hypothetical protein [Pseudomonas]AVB17843.1 hypothetical protein BKM19_031355 [Pseudomonas amygdali pv. morsprunorum]AVB23536.1 hypothetical protein BKM03_31465 [Pseudomonas avellanae]KWS59914.1 hypothetical protein AL054_09125 [Pseudomonas amygdali pv. morsprunorum]KWS63691.1 hypothetical protein AL055_25220 [Pseudomonas amygdali pv. morsprunorum]PHX25831.1 hypothetical protein AO282_19655 [Pseudomonas amygdali pv. morsprunorum]